MQTAQVLGLIADGYARMDAALGRISRERMAASEADGARKTSSRTSRGQSAR